MKRILSILLLSIYGFAASAQDTAFADSIQFYNPDYSASREASEILQQQQTISAVYLTGMLLAIFACIAISYIYKRRIRKYSELINIQSQNLNAQKHQTESFGLMLNLAQFPCCLVRADGELIWCNEAFVDFYGKDRKRFSVEDGCGTQEIDPERLKSERFGTTFFVKMKNIRGKVIGFRRTVIPIKEGEQGFAVIENIIE